MCIQQVRIWPAVHLVTSAMNPGSFSWNSFLAALASRIPEDALIKAININGSSRQQITAKFCCIFCATEAVDGFVKVSGRGEAEN